MEAVILSGGFGTRLKPITESIPKPLVPLANRPLVEWVIQALPPTVDKVVLSVGYMADAVEEHFRGWEGPREVAVVREEEPLGTGGGLKNAEKHLGTMFVVMNGDVISSVDVGEMVEYHIKKEAETTIALWEVEDVSAYGAVALDSDMRIRSFVEKPDHASAPSRMINAGVYVMSHEVLDLMEPGRACSLERDVFPEIARRQSLYGFRFAGHWVDAGTRENFLRANALLIRDAVPDVKEPGVSYTPPVLMGDGTVIEPGAEIGPNVTLGDRVWVASDAKIQNAVIMDGTSVGPGAVVTDSVIGRGSMLQEGVRVDREIIGCGVAV